MYLCKTGIRKIRSFFTGFPYRRNIASHGIGGKIEYIAVTSGAEQHSMGRMAFNFAGNQVTCNNTSRFPVDHYHIEHFMSVVYFYVSGSDHAAESRICTQQQLLTGLAFGIKSTLYLRAPERTVVQQ